MHICLIYEVVVGLNNKVNTVVVEVDALIAYILSALCEAFTCVDKLNLARALRRFIFGHEPNIGGYTCVIK